ncbi:MAG TPA: transposase [Propionicimonas sp.]|nr:transposase [Propionicimonas sp.]
MPRQARQLVESGIYHVMLRGVNRDAIFLEDEDRERFLYALARVHELSGCVVLAYCLMTNHVHLVLRSVDEPIGDVVKRLGVRYAGWFNGKYGRVGHLFQDRFKSVGVETDAHLLALVRYVWNNPVEAGLTTRPQDYPWSSHRLLESDSALVRAEDLRKLLPPDALTAECVPCIGVVEGFEQARKGRPRLHTDAGVARLIEQVCGITTANEFGDLDLRAQRRIVRELRTRSVPYEQIAKATGMSASSVRRLHIVSGSNSVRTV